MELHNIKFYICIKAFHFCNSEKHNSITEIMEILLQSHDSITEKNFWIPKM